MSKISRRDALASLAGAAAVAHAQSGGEWISLFDGKSLKGWQASENESSWSVKDGCLSGAGPRSHLFYAGAVRNAHFKNFEFRAEVMTRGGTNSGIYFHTAYRPQGWPPQGFEVQINNTHVGEGNYRERKKTGSLYGVRNTYKTLAKDDEWFEMRIAVREARVQVWVKDKLVVDYVEPDPPVRAVDDMERVLGAGTFALQNHDPKSPVLFRNIAVRPLPDDVAGGAERPVVDDVYRELLRMSAQNYPVVDYHVHLKANFTLQEALQLSRQTGIGYGLAINVGVGFAVSSDAGARDFQALVRDQPVFVALQGEGREWPTLVSKETIAGFDYVFTDAMTFRDDNGRRMKLWIKDDVGRIPDPERFVEMYLNRIVGVLEQEPIDIYVSPTFLPEVIQSQYDRLWTPERMRKVIEAAKKNDVAIEINNRYRVPSAAFIRMAKEAGVKFTFGSNNADRNVGRLEYPIQMVRECGLTWRDFFVPRPHGRKPVQLRG